MLHMYETITLIKIENPNASTVATNCIKVYMQLYKITSLLPWYKREDENFKQPYVLCRK